MNDPHAQTPWYRQLAAVLAQHMLLKSLGTMLFIAVFFGAYFFLLKNPASAVTVMPLTWPDRLIGFEPRAMALYVSLWVYVSLPPALLATPQALFAYARAMAGTCMIGLVIFYLWPTTVPVADIDWALYPGVDFLKTLDAGGNAFPSLHVVTAVFSGVWLQVLLRRFDAPRWTRWLNALWCVGIVYSTLATRQHVAVDVAAGLLLGALAAAWSLRHLLPLKSRPIKPAAL
ncbi:MAG: phosphatase PAP2 family protein [Gammaproteobacteria bacterium]|uniref:phosphatase PAP2 family protein n=1 Tax=Rhodoferax sp. TaxID=50421 RepID=UPI0017FA8B25|nr:phosphatase PAP2 family protein [Rhodoferax sp.]MBU3898340.1 phosphatase PAP2 family protein [Gammaproteobacteria bacterium]MBA3058683.1 phosphatase PAP2 family protein [Rhodoferax sp.]MBU3996173.1 phosphatase PAP2 family protein [Gammaproteobacteria bacterium]MBU4081525.1 phosphatase PAP2 family protein [Gammaproteobacteria bacterium]MBU4114904.1 phosphatase PAP2 family protein [Gammaproteobacteria bacterium]